MVRLRVDVKLERLQANSFQFRHGAIKRIYSDSLYTFNSDFNSDMVRLRAGLGD